ncbi:MAG: DUF4432 domain-containing protein [Pirellulaceae bacterium]|nr:MAG: DUF4432 domain-containing protein [Pirellulaceae bacterium]
MRVPLPSAHPATSPPKLDRMPDSALEIPCADGIFRLSRVRLEEGPCDGVELLIVDAGKLRAAVCPTRGMSVWKARCGNTPLQWESPVRGPIHPSYVALDAANGLGWLDGFDELLVRCGLGSFGAPDFDGQGRLLYPLHGRIGNLPARNVQVSVDKQHSLLELRGAVHETRFLQYDLRLEVIYRFTWGEPVLDITDRVTNARAVDSSMQLLYHINIGEPFLGAGSRLNISAPRVVARDARAAEDLASWEHYLGPTAGYAEQVYFFQPRAIDGPWATAMLTSPDEELGVCVHFDPRTLPFFSQWKHTAAQADGYVTGLEPGTGFPNPRSFEQQHGRVVAMQAGETREFRLQLEVQETSAAVEAMRKRLQPHLPRETAAMDADWCMPR